MPKLYYAALFERALVVVKAAVVEVFLEILHIAVLFIKGAVRRISAIRLLYWAAMELL
jgi:hypothetical protein